MAAQDDLSSLFAGQTPGRLVMGQATITAWDPATYLHTLSFRGATIRNVGVLHSVSALGYRPGDVVMLLGWEPERGTSSWWIVGRALIPGQDSPDLTIRGSDLIVEGGRLRAADNEGDVFRVDPTVPEIFMRQALIENVSRQIISDTIHSDTAEGSENVSSDTGGFITLPDGPEVTFTTVSGRWQLAYTANTALSATGGGEVCNIGYDVSGAQTLAPALSRSSSLQQTVSGSIITTMAHSRVHTGDPGEITVGLRYRLDQGAGTGSATFRLRTLTVIAF